MGVGVYCITNSGSVISVSVFLSVVFAFEHGISESNKDRSLNVEALMISDIIGPNRQQ